MSDVPAQAAPTSKPAFALESFTDEELAILGGAGGIVVAPFLSRISEGQLLTAQRTAFRGLIARGIVDPPTEQLLTAPTELKDERGHAGPGTEIAVREDVHAMVMLRASAQIVVAVARTAGSRQDFWYAHVVDDTCLLEEVGTDGIHRFAMLDAARLPEAVVEATVHPETGDGAGNPVEFTPSADHAAPPTILKILGEALVHCEVVIRTASDVGVVMFGVFTGPNGAWLFRNTFGSEQPVVARPCTSTEVRERLRVATVDALEGTHRS